MRRALAWTSILLLVGAAAWIVVDGRSGRGAAVVPVEEAGTGRLSAPGPARAGGAGPAGTATPGEAQEAASRRIPVEATARRVTVTLVDEQGESVPGQLAWLQVVGRPPFHSSAEYRDACTERGAVSCPVPREGVEIEVDPEAWVTLTARSGEGVARRTLAPDSRPTDVGLEIATGARVLDVVVLERDLSRTVVEGSIGLVGPGGSDSVPIDPSGVTRIDLGSRVRLTLLAPGAQLADGSPHAVRVPLPVATSRVAAGMVLVRSGPRADVRVHLTVDGDPQRGVAALRRLDDGSGTVLPCREPLRAGEQELCWARVEAGDYELITGPAGCLRLVAGDGLEPCLRVRGGGEVVASGRLVENTERVRLELAGLDRFAGPFRVLTQRVDGVVDCAPDSPRWIGPLRWRDLAAEVAPVVAPVRLVAQGRGGVWLATSAWAGEAAALDFEPATWLEVSWQPDQWLPAHVWVELSGQHGLSGNQGDEVLPLRLGFTERGLPAGPAFRGSCCVPRRACTLTCVGEDRDGNTRTLWQRSVDPRGPRTVVSEPAVD